ncbi:LuxR C-terminal-related transcriptional regulator [Pseudonocardia adelaidensis]|uniref:LuxR C-terminal-related transcriptional regulator n=1 Tax=Pseudonocardia adelaidensis TaxID=648754 RepID=UPI0031EBF490
MLDEAAAGQVTVVTAPAGYGKTLLLAEWAARRPEQTAWVSLDDDDSDDRRFWSAVLASLGSCAAVPAGNPLHALIVPGRPSRDPVFLAAVVDAIAALPGPVRLVLDDIHELTAPDPLHGLAALVRDRPAALHLVLSGRAEPPVPLGRMRLAGQLREIRADLLRFSVPEAAEMLVAADTPVSPDQLRLLVEQTEGWAAGLRLAALSLREVADPDRFLTDLVGNGRAVSDYLVGEILSRLPVGTRELLGAVSICSELSAPLAVALSGRADAGEVLDSLERETGLVLSMGEGRTWYRLHRLLRSHLRADLRRQRPDAMVRLYGRAADWFAAEGQPAAALTYARRGGAPDRVVRLLREHATTLIAAGEHELVRTALDWLGAPFRGDPWLALVAALVATEGGALAQADAHIARAVAAWPSDPAPELVALRGLVRSRRVIVAGDPDDTPGETGSQAAEELGLGPMAMLHRGIGSLGEGRPDEARDIVGSALGRARQQHHGYLAALGLTLLAVIAGMEGDYRRMTELAEAADAEPGNPAWPATIGAGWSSTMRAYGALLRADPAECLDLVAADETGPERSLPEYSDDLLVLRTALRGAALFDLGRTGEGLDGLRDAQLVAAGRPGSPEVTATVAVLVHRATTLLGRTDLARAALSRAENGLRGSGEVGYLRARHQAAIGRYRAASETLAPLLDGSVPFVLPWIQVEARVLECQLALRLERRPEARRALDDALSLTAAMDVLRPLASSPPEVIDLLTRHVGSFGAEEPTTARVLAARRTLGAQPVPLTDRERAVLSLLPTQRSFEEIAVDLTVSHSTVKTHVRAIYSKFGVSSRRDAVASARLHGILSSDA